MTGRPTRLPTSDDGARPDDLAVLPPAMAELVDDFQAVTEPDRLQLLLELSKELPEIGRAHV